MAWPPHLTFLHQLAWHVSVVLFADDRLLLFLMKMLGCSLLPASVDNTMRMLMLCIGYL